MHVPGWHEATKELQKQGRVRMVGIIQEQHPERARLFMQWKQMGWPILVDSLNLLGVSAVPITVALDEQGVVRMVRLPLAESKQIEEKFVKRTYDKPLGSTEGKPRAPDLNQLKSATRKGNADAWRQYADALVLWGGPQRLGEAIQAYQRALELQPDHAPTHFRLGVAHRKRYDSELRQANDFQKAVEQWARALDLNPNQYIWRRRIQQYGPRLDKPYSFYDWVVPARKEIEVRGETPLALAVEPGGAEFAKPAKSFESTADSEKQPDPQGRIARDKGKFITVEATAVPPAVAPGGAARLHLVFRPNLRNKAHWNNEVDNLVVWLNPPGGWQAERHSLTVVNPPKPVSQEVRRVEFELRSPEQAPPGSITIPAYALYYVCEDVNGTCLYRRQDVAVAIQVKSRRP